MPKVTEITVSAGRTFNHPYESYSNLKPMLTMKATISEGEDPEQAIRALQEQAERMIEDHKERTLAEIRACYRMAQTRQEVNSLKRQLSMLQAKLSEFGEDELISLTNNDEDDSSDAL